MDSSVLPKEEVWFLCVCNHISKVLVSEEKKVNLNAFFLYRIECFSSLLCIHLQAYVRVITIPDS